MGYQNLFEAIVNVTGFTPLESDMLDIIEAYKKDIGEERIYPEVVWPEGVAQYPLTPKECFRKEESEYRLQHGEITFEQYLEIWRKEND